MTQSKLTRDNVEEFFLAKAKESIAALGLAVNGAQWRTSVYGLAFGTMPFMCEVKLRNPENVLCYLQFNYEFNNNGFWIMSVPGVSAYLTPELYDGNY